MTSRRLTNSPSTMSAGPKVLVAGALNILQDLSNGSNIPALQPLVSLAVRIYTSAEGAKSNKKNATALAQAVCNSIEQIKQVYPPGSNSQDLYADGIREFQRALEDVAAFVEKIVQRNRFWRILNQEEDRQELSDYRTKIIEAKLHFLVAMELSKSQTLQREQKYPVFTLADLELQQMLNETNPKHTRVVLLGELAPPILSTSGEKRVAVQSSGIPRGDHQIDGRPVGRSMSPYRSPFGGKLTITESQLGS
ncbi:hypothetical protein B0H16DRAFT_1619666 [Mycena metata]|uniref:Mixed lineage kinase domain-containing protein n=1 Tax=Mycena metata TaxID=1033252 RepID=A0AAD7MEW6_9AGAR|nr:hypothetical protein B0H16DRAFT_1619666 [Mycena metata]